MSEESNVNRIREGHEHESSRPSRDPPVIRRALGLLTTGLEETIPAVLLTVMTFTVTADVVLRYVFSQPQAWVHELALLLFVWQIFLGAAGAARRRLHIGVEFFAGLLRGRIRALQLLLAQMLVLAIVGISTLFAFQFALEARREFETLGVSYLWMYMAVPVGLGLFFIHATGHAVSAFRGLVTGDISAEIRLSGAGFKEMEMSRSERERP